MPHAGDAEAQECLADVLSAQSLEAAMAGSTGEQARHGCDYSGHAVALVVAKTDGDPAALWQAIGIKRSQCPRGAQPGTGDGRAGMPGQSDGIAKTVVQHTVGRGT